MTERESKHFGKSEGQTEQLSATTLCIYIDYCIF